MVIALMMEAVRTSETSVNLYQTTRHNIPDDSHLQTNNQSTNAVIGLLCYLLCSSVNSVLLLTGAKLFVIAEVKK
jgi:hypothetical protein